MSFMIDRLLVVYCLFQEYLIWIETSQISLRGLKFETYKMTLMAFEQGGMFIVPFLIWHGTSLCLHGLLPRLVAFDDKPDVLKTNSNPDPHEIKVFYSLKNTV